VAQLIPYLALALAAAFLVYLVLRWIVGRARRAQRSTMVPGWRPPRLGRFAIYLLGVLAAAYSVNWFVLGLLGPASLLKDARDARFTYLLLSRPELVSSRDEHGDTPAHNAASAGDTGRIRLLLSLGADPNSLDRHSNETPLFEALRYCHGDPVKIVEQLLAAGAEAGWRNASGTTPLHLAAAGGHSWTIRALLDAGADIDAVAGNAESFSPGFNGETPLLSALDSCEEEAAKLLIERGARVDKSSRARGSGPLVLAMACRELELMALLLKRGADPNDPSNSSMPYSLLQLAYLRHYLPAVQLLEQHGATIRRTAEGGRRSTTDLTVAAWAGDRPRVEQLLADENTDLEEPDQSKLRALNYVVARGYRGIVDLLLARGAQPGKLEKSESALETAIWSERTEMLEPLFAAGAELGPFELSAAIEREDLELVKVVLRSGVDLNAKGRHGWKPLDRAAEQGNLKLVELLLAAGAKIEEGSGHHSGNPPLCHALVDGHDDIVELLRRHGAKGDWRSCPRRI
jgi:ankyrin repeat protein